MKPINADIVKMMKDLDFKFKKEIIWVNPDFISMHEGNASHLWELAQLVCLH